VVVACVEGEEHDVGAHMVADFLEAAGFDVRFLGANVPTRTLEALVEDQRPELLALSATTQGSVREIRRVVTAIRRAANGPISIAIGGQLIAAYPGLRKNLGVIYAARPPDLVAAALGRLDRS
jgi:methanogenic corrinoid protein MtbC1